MRIIRPADGIILATGITRVFRAICFYLTITSVVGIARTICSLLLATEGITLIGLAGFILTVIAGFSVTAIIRSAIGFACATIIRRTI